MIVGNKVVCIDDNFPKPLLKYYQQTPVKGQTYTVRAVYLARGAMHTAPGKTDGEVGILLQELHNPPDPKHLGASELGFNSMRFRELEGQSAEETKEQVEDLVYKEPLKV